jgi:hypothetical protein
MRRNEMERMLRTLGIAVIAVSAIACATQYQVAGADRAAGADGLIEIESQDGGNYSVTIEAENLLPPGRLGDGLTTYVVWFQPADQEAAQRMGTLDYDEDDRTGEMMATTTHTSFTVIVTGETQANETSPSDNVVFRQDVNAE